ncbi:TRAP transporter small permease subunit [Sulfurospirillum arcachonense]|uniref:TRAP transporter small permease subunit n=1 Tax=Sulfurospirillum arcachonense TaxID=57666 RepID=UPI0004B5B85D|nr:TRAP transporter small permease subunit [Sulfurospirillum arcachonense]
MLLKLERAFDKFADFIGNITGILMVLMMINVFFDVIMRYFFNTGSIGMQEMEWHLFSIVFLLGVSYSLKEDGHVRVDVIYDNLNYKKKAIINIVGTFIFLIPFALLIGFGSLEFVQESFQTAEISGDPGGLTHRWIIKSFVPASMVLLCIVAVGFIIKNINMYLGLHGHPHDFKEDSQ